MWLCGGQLHDHYDNNSLETASSETTKIFSHFHPPYIVLHCLETASSEIMKIFSHFHPPYIVLHGLNSPLLMLEATMRLQWSSKSLVWRKSAVHKTILLADAGSWVSQLHKMISEMYASHLVSDYRLQLDDLKLAISVSSVIFKFMVY